MRRPVVCVTGAGGEIGHALIARLAASGRDVVTIDVAPLEPSLGRHVRRAFVGSVTDQAIFERVLAEFEVDLIVHLAALLSTRSEFTPASAHDVNVNGTLRVLEFAQQQGLSHGRMVTVVYPSSIAAYGLPDFETKTRVGRVKEDDWNTPRTMYGCNKLYCEHLGRYYSRHYQQLATDVTPRVDFRSVRFPGLISAITLPAGGTSDYAPEMIHAAAAGQSYRCFVRPDTQIPFMAMPDAIEALLALAAAPRTALTRTTYNLSAFSTTAEEIRRVTLEAFPDAEITWAVDGKRQAIVDSWPADVDDSAARRDWGFAPQYDRGRAFDEYLIPTVTARYR